MNLTDPTKTTKIRALLCKDARKDFEAFLLRNADDFPRSHEDMPDTDPGVIAHLLNVDLQYKPVRRKHKSFNPEHYEAIKAKVDKLLKADFIRNVDYPT